MRCSYINSVVFLSKSDIIRPNDPHHSDQHPSAREWIWCEEDLLTPAVICHSIVKRGMWQLRELLLRKATVPFWQAESL